MTCRRSRCGVLAFAAAALAVAAALAMPMFARSAAAYAAPAGPPTVVYDSAAREFFACGAGTVEADVSTLTKTGDSPYALAALAAAVGAAAVLAAVLVRSRRGSR